MKKLLRSFKKIQRSETRRNIFLFKMFQAFREPLFWGPILIRYLNEIGKMDLGSIYQMEGVALLFMVFMEISTGTLADWIGRKKTMLAGSIILAFECFLFATVKSPVGCWVADLTWVIGASLSSGADSAFLHDVLKEKRMEKKFTQIQGEGIGFRLLFTAIMSSATGWLYQIHPRLPLFVSIPGILLSICLVFLMKETYFKKETKQNNLNFWQIMSKAFRIVWHNRQVQWIIAFSLLIGISSKFWFFTYNPYFELVGLGVKTYGYIFTALNLVAFIFSRYAHKIENHLKEKTSVKLMILILGLPILTMGTIIKKPMILLVLLQNIVRGYSTPFIGSFLNRHIESQTRATMISINSAISSLVYFIVSLPVGWFLKNYPLPLFLQILGISVLVLGSLLIFLYRKIF